MTDPLPEDQRLKDISPKAYEHPADRAATAALQSIPMLDTVVRKLIEFGYERALRQIFLAGSLQLGSEQLPEGVGVAPRGLRAARPPRGPGPLPDAVPDHQRGGDRRPTGRSCSSTRARSTCSTSDELRTVLGHEAGHILSDHVLYRTALMILLGARHAARLPLMAGLPLLAVKLALLEWFRAAELSCDRAATLVNRDPLVTCRTLMVLAGGVDVAQAQPRRLPQAGQRVRGVGAGLGQALAPAHASWGRPTRRPVRRVSELMKWVRSGEYDRIMNGEYVRRGDPVEPPRARPATPPSSTPSASAASSRTPGRRGQGRRQGRRRRREAQRVAARPPIGGHAPRCVRRRSDASRDRSGRPHAAELLGRRDRVVGARRCRPGRPAS